MRPTARPRCAARPAPPRRADPTATVVLGTRSDATEAAANTSAARNTVARGLDQQEQRPGDAERRTRRGPQISWSFELASTSPASSVDDHRARWPPWPPCRSSARTSIRNASGNSHRLSEPTLATMRIADDDAAEARPDEDHAMPAPGTVHGGADQRTDHGEGRHREDEVEDDLPAGPGGIDVEEQRSRERHRDERVAPERQRVGQGEAAERGRAWRRRPTRRPAAAAIS